VNPNPDPNHAGHRALEQHRREQMRPEANAYDSNGAAYEKETAEDGTPVHSKSYRLMLSEQTAPRRESKAARRMRRRSV
jgi:hypothetical protein